MDCTSRPSFQIGSWISLALERRGRSGRHRDGQRSTVKQRALGEEGKGREGEGRALLKARISSSISLVRYTLRSLVRDRMVLYHKLEGGEETL